MKIRIYRYLERTKTAGPGWRFCIWVQGCSRRCEGCAATETWAHDSGTEMETDTLWKIISAVNDIEGITFLGGEPAEQPEAVADLAEKAQKSGLSVVIFTGFSLQELQNNTGRFKPLLDSADLLIDGPFDQEQFDLSRPWVGSSNQKFHFLTDRYGEKETEKVRNRIEIRIAADGRATINGMGDFSDIKKLL